jgi:hypothetical protein
MLGNTQAQSSQGQEARKDPDEQRAQLDFEQAVVQVVQFRSGAESPASEKNCQIEPINNSTLIDIASSGPAPVCENIGEICGINILIVIDIGRAIHNTRKKDRSRSSRRSTADSNEI